MKKKYELTETKNERGLYQIRALIDIPSKGVKKGDLGGYIQSEDNLSHEGSCWVGDSAMVSGKAKVFGEAEVYGDARVSGNAWVYGEAEVYGDAWVFDNARVYGDARVSGNAWVYGEARVYGDARVSDYARVYGDARVYENAYVYGEAEVYGKSKISGNGWVFGRAIITGECHVKKTDDYVCIGPVGNHQRYITFTKSNKMVKAGCFHGDLKEFKRAVDAKYGGEGNYYEAIKQLEQIKYPSFFSRIFG